MLIKITIIIIKILLFHLYCCCFLNKTLMQNGFEKLLLVCRKRKAGATSPKSGKLTKYETLHCVETPIYGCNFCCFFVFKSFAHFFDMLLSAYWILFCDCVFLASPNRIRMDSKEKAAETDVNRFRFCFDEDPIYW